jgi:hypothetical protein
MRKLNIGEKFFIRVDPQSHGDDMGSIRVELEVVERQAIGLDIGFPRDEVDFIPSGTGGIDLHIAVCRILSWVELHDDGTPRSAEEQIKPCEFETLVRVGDERWHHTVWIMPVDFES